MYTDTEHTASWLVSFKCVYGAVVDSFLNTTRRRRDFHVNNNKHSRRDLAWVPIIIPLLVSHFSECVCV